METIIWIFDLLGFIFIFPLTAGIIKYKHLNREMKLLVILLIVIGIVETSTFIMGVIYLVDYHWLHHIYAPVEYGILAYIFSFWVRPRIIRKVLLISIPCLVVISIVNTFYFQNLTEFNSNTITLMQVLYSMMSSYALYILMKKDYGNIYRNYIFWVASGVLIFSTGDLAYFAFYHWVNENYLVAIWAIHVIFNVVINIFYLIGILCQAKQWE